MMKGLFVFFICSLFICSCNTNKSKDNKNASCQKSEHKFLTVVGTNMNDSVIMYTNDGHIFLYSTDSIGNYIVNYAKFDYLAGGYESIKDKLVRVELDSSMQFIKSIVSVHGIALFFEEEGMYNVTYYDEYMHQKQLNDINVRNQSIYNENSTDITNNIILQLVNAYDISHYISDNNENGWYFISSSLESICALADYDNIEQDKVYNKKVKERLPRIIKAAEGLTLFCNTFSNIK